MSARARVDAMKPSRPGSTRTADPRPPDQFWTRGNYLPYVLFGSCGFLLYAVAFGVLRAVWVLGERDPAAWKALLASYAHPLYLVFHAFALVALTWFTFRFFRLFPKTQPARIGPAKPPPAPVILFALNAIFVVATLAAALVLAGAIG